MRQSSASSLVASPVEPTRSQNITVSGRRSASARHVGGGGEEAARAGFAADGGGSDGAESASIARGGRARDGARDPGRAAPDSKRSPLARARLSARSA